MTDINDILDALRVKIKPMATNDQAILKKCSTSLREALEVKNAINATPPAKTTGKK